MEDNLILSVMYIINLHEYTNFSMFWVYFVTQLNHTFEDTFLFSCGGEFEMAPSVNLCAPGA